MSKNQKPTEPLSMEKLKLADELVTEVSGLSLEQRMKNLQANFDALEGRRRALATQLEQVQQEQLRMQGEHRLLQALIAQEQAGAKSSG